MRYLDRRRENDDEISYYRSIDRSFGCVERRTLCSFFCSSVLFFMNVCVQPYVRKRHWSESERAIFLLLLLSSFLSVHRQNRSTHTYTSASRDEGLVHHHLSPFSFSFTICTAGCLSISIKPSTCPLNWEECNSRHFSLLSLSLSSNGYLLFALIEGGGQQQRIVVIATHTQRVVVVKVVHRIYV